MEIARILGSILVLVLLYAAVQTFIGLREFRSMVRRDRAEGRGTIGNKTPSESVMAGGGGYYVILAVELGLAAVIAWLVVR
jgi:hypothetical protein